MTARSARFDDALRTADFVLAEGSVYERLRRHPGIVFDPDLAYGSFVYEPESAGVLASVHREYLEVGRRHGLPMVVFTATWRTNLERVRRSRFHHRAVNEDNVRFVRDVVTDRPAGGPPVYVGGQVGPRGDAYRPGEALPRDRAAEFHRPQIEALAEAGPDFLFAATLPALSEAEGIAAAMARTALPYVLSFVVRPSGTLLDGTPLREAMERIDSTVPRPPLGYSLNCVHPLVVREALARAGSGPLRVISVHANTSARSPEELDGLPELETEAPDTLADAMWGLAREFRIPVLGGCCGTSTEHIEALARRAPGRRSGENSSPGAPPQ